LQAHLNNDDTFYLQASIVLDFRYPSPSETCMPKTSDNMQYKRENASSRKQ